MQEELDQTIKIDGSNNDEKINHKKHKRKLKKKNNTAKYKYSNSFESLTINKKSLDKFKEKAKKNNENENKEFQEKDNKEIIKTNYKSHFSKNIENLISLNKSNYNINQSNELLHKRKNKVNDKKVNLYNDNNYLRINKNNKIRFILLNSKFKENPQYSPEYIDDILTTLLREEKNYYYSNKEISNLFSLKRRNQYIFLLLYLCDSLTNKQEVCYLSINIFERVISKIIDSKKDLTNKDIHLILITSLFIAFKYETGKYFDINELNNYIRTPLVTKNEVLQYEYNIYKILDYDFLIVYPSLFLKYYFLVDNNNNRGVYYYSLNLIRYILFDLNMIYNKPSLISACCYFISKVKLLKDNNWSYDLQFLFGYSKKEIIKFSTDIIKNMAKLKKENINIFEYLKANFPR